MLSAQRHPGIDAKMTLIYFDVGVLRQIVVSHWPPGTMQRNPLFLGVAVGDVVACGVRIGENFNGFPILW